jgi:hypothetical protein
MFANVESEADLTAAYGPKSALVVTAEKCAVYGERLDVIQAA